MPVLASAGPRPRPTPAHDGGTPQPSTPRLRDGDGSWAGAPQPPAARRHRRVNSPVQLVTAIFPLICVNVHLRRIMRQSESAIVTLRNLYNQVVLLLKMLERLHDMLTYGPQAEQVARGANIDGADALAGDVQEALPHWSVRILPKALTLLADMHHDLSDLSTACRTAADRQASELVGDGQAVAAYANAKARQLHGFRMRMEQWMIPCKFIHIVRVCSLYRGNSALPDVYRHVCVETSRDRLDAMDQSALYWFWTGLDTAAAVDAARRDARRKGTRAKKPAKAGQSGTLPAASPGDLLAALLRNDYQTAFAMLVSGIELNAMLPDGTFVLSHAVGRDNAAVVSILAVCGARPDVRHRDGSTPLHTASSENHVSSALVLLSLGADVDSRDSNGSTPLHLACAHRNFSIVLHLLAYGADPNALDDHGLTPLANALAHPSNNVVATLLAYGARMTSREHAIAPITAAVLSFNHASVARCLDKDPDSVDTETPVATLGRRTARGSLMLRPLHAAVVAQNFIACRLLISRGAAVNHIVAAFGARDTYLHMAVLSGTPRLVALLLAAGADANIPGNDGRAPLHLAASLLGAAGAKAETLRLLLQHGADWRATTHKTQSQPLHVAVAFGRPDACDLLLARGADVNQPIRGGITPLMLAAYWRNKTAVRFLLLRGADVFRKTPIYGETAMHAACRAGCVEIASVLAKRGLSVNATYPFVPAQPSSVPRHPLPGSSSSSSSSSTSAPTARAAAPPAACASASEHPGGHASTGYAPIHVAAACNQLDMVCWLVRHGADPEARIGTAALRECLGGGAEDSTTAHPEGDEHHDVGATPVEVARAFGHERVAAFLEDVLHTAEAQRMHAPPPRFFLGDYDGLLQSGRARKPCRDPYLSDDSDNESDSLVDPCFPAAPSSTMTAATAAADDEP